MNRRHSPEEVARRTLISDVAAIIGVLSAAAGGVMVIVAALNWVYGELNNVRASVNSAKTEIAETRAQVQALGKTVDKVDAKLDYMLLPQKKRRISTQSDRRIEQPQCPDAPMPRPTKSRPRRLFITPTAP